MKKYVITAKEVADWLRLSRSTIYRLVKDGEIPFSKRNGFIGFDVQELVEWLDSKRVNG